MNFRPEIKWEKTSNDTHRFQWKYNSQEISKTENERNQKSSLAINLQS